MTPGSLPKPLPSPIPKNLVLPAHNILRIIHHQRFVSEMRQKNLKYNYQTVETANLAY